MITLTKKLDSLLLNRAAILQFYDDRTGATARSYLRPGVLRQHAALTIDAVWIGGGRESDNPNAQKC